MTEEKSINLVVCSTDTNQLTEVVPRRVERHAGNGRGVCDGFEGFLSRGLTVVEQLDCEIQ